MNSRLIGPALRVALLVVMIAGLTAWSPPAQAVGSDDTFVTVASDPMDLLALGQNRQWLPSNSHVHVFGSPNSRITVGVGDGPAGSEDNLEMNFEPAQGEVLTTGTYENAQDSFYDDPNRPGIAFQSAGSAGCSPGGRFQILDITPDLSRLWILYEVGCEDAVAGPKAFGEIKFHEPAADSEILVAPDRVAWPSGDLGLSKRVVPITVVNRSAQTFVASAATITGDADFRIVHNGCGDLAPGGSCVITVGFTPLAVGQRTAVLSVTDSTARGHHEVPLSGSGTGTFTSLRTHNPPANLNGTGFGPDQNRNSGNGSFAFSPDPEYIHGRVRLADSVLPWDFAFIPPDNDRYRRLEAGRTYPAGRFASAAPPRAGLQVSGNGAGCNEVHGAFHVHEINYSGDTLKGFSITFEQRCDRSTAPPMYGSIAWHASSPAQPVPTHPFGPRPTSLSIHAAPARSGTDPITGRLLNVDARRFMGSRRVRLEWRPHQAAAWHILAYDTTNSRGVYAFHVHPTQLTHYRTRYVGSPNYQAALSAVTSLR